MEWNHLIGRTLGDDSRYEIFAELGHGGSGRIYRAWDRIGERDVAIKMLPNDAEDRHGFIRRFEREAQAFEQLHHPNIVAVYDRGETEELVYLVLQCVTGGTLRTRLGRPLPPGEAADAIIQMAHALHYAHQHGVIHRDVKPSNMLLDAGNPRRLLLTDFGIAKLEGMRGLTKTGTTIGTPEYMAPEQATGSEVDHRADVYALGCVLYETLCGRPPFVGATPVSVLYQHVHVRPPYLRAFNSQVPRGLVRVVQQALAKRPEERFDTAQALAQALYPFTENRELASGSGNVEPAVASVSWPTLEGETERGGEGKEEEEEEAAAMESGQTGHPSHRWGAEGLDAIFPADAETPAAPTKRTLAAIPPTSLHSRAMQSEPEDLPLPEPPVPTQPTQPSALNVSAAERHLPPARHMEKPTPPLELSPTPDNRLDVTTPLAPVERAQHAQRTQHAPIVQHTQTLPRLTPPRERQSFSALPAAPALIEHGPAQRPDLTGAPAAPLKAPARWEAGEPPGESRGGHGGRGRAGMGARKRSTSPLLLVGAAALAVVVITSGVLLLNHANAGLHRKVSASPAGMLTPSSIATGPSPSSGTTTVTPGATSTATAGATGGSTPVATPTPQPPHLTIAPNPWSLSGGFLSPCSSGNTSQTITNAGPHAVSWAWQSSGAPSPSRDNLQYRLNSSSRVPGLPNHASLAAGGTDTLAVWMSCTGKTYTVSVSATDLVTGAHTSFTFTLQVP